MKANGNSKAPFRLAIAASAVILMIVPARRIGAQTPATCQGCESAEALIRRYDLREDRTPMRDRDGWTPPRKIVAIGTAEMFAPLQAAVRGVDFVTVPDLDSAPAAMADADVLIGQCTSEILDAAQRLRWIQLPSAGVELCVPFQQTLQERGIIVTNMQALYGPQIAETAIAMVLAFARGFTIYHAQQLAGEWNHDPADAAAIIASGIWELDGKTMLVVGLGGLGTEVARRANALGMRVLATRNSSHEGPDFVEYVGLADEAWELAARADVVVNATPLTPDTRGMFDAAFFRAMKPSSYFINIGRGASVVTDDLVAALRDGTLAGAGLDVTDPEPLPAGHPLWSLPNALLLPHVAAGSDYLLTRALMLAGENIRRYAAGDALLSVVDLRRGY